jgi:CBS domain-containing membrane protein
VAFALVNPKPAKKKLMRTPKEVIKHFSFYLGGDQPPVSWQERARTVLGAFIGIMLVLTTAKYLGETVGIDEWLMASLGASALLVFALPQSPLAQPWAVIGGNTLSALVGISCAHFMDLPITVALALAVSLSILGMFVLRCLHPPAAAVALIAVLGHVLHYRYAFFPVMVDSILLVVAGAIYSNLTGKAYPNHPK